jgi:hypothetical protein
MYVHEQLCVLVMHKVASNGDPHALVHDNVFLTLYLFLFGYEYWLIMVLHHVMKICWPILQQVDAESDVEAVIAVAEIWSTEGSFECEVCMQGHARVRKLAICSLVRA